MFNNWCRSCRLILYVYVLSFPSSPCPFRRFALNCQFYSLSHSIFKQFHHFKWRHLQLSYLCARSTLRLLLSLSVSAAFCRNYIQLPMAYLPVTIIDTEEQHTLGSALDCFSSVLFNWLYDIFHFYWQNVIPASDDRKLFYMVLIFRYFKSYITLCLTWTWILREPDRAEKSVTLRMKIPLNELIDNLQVAVSIYELEITLRAHCERQTNRYGDGERGRERLINQHNVYYLPNTFPFLAAAFHSLAILRSLFLSSH